MESTLSANPHWSQVVNNVGVGVGALFAGLGGLKVFFDWAEERMQKNKRKRLETELKMKYPPSKIGKTFDLIQSTSKPGMIYLLDFETDKKHHIASLSTFVSLGYDHSMVKGLGQKVFNKYEEGDEFLTEGERFS